MTSSFFNNQDENNKDDSEDDNLEKYVHGTILKALDEADRKNQHDESEKAENKTLPNKKFQLDPYSKIFEAKSLPETKLFIYNLATYVVPLYDDSGEKIPQSAVDGDIGRGVFVFKTMIILAIQIFCTMIFMIGGVFIQLSDEFKQKNNLAVACLCGLILILHCIIYFWPWLRKTFPFSYVILTMFTSCSIYALGSFHSEFSKPIYLLYTLSGVMGLFVILCIISCVPCCQFTSSGFYAILNQILPFMFITFLISSLYSLSCNVFYILFILLVVFLVVYLIIECSFLVHLFQLISGRGGKHAMKTDEHILASVILYIHINTIHLILLIILSIAPYAPLALSVFGRLGMLPSCPKIPSLSDGISKVSESISKVSEGVSSKVSEGISKVSEKIPNLKEDVSKLSDKIPIIKH